MPADSDNARLANRLAGTPISSARAMPAVAMARVCRVACSEQGQKVFAMGRWPERSDKTAHFALAVAGYQHAQVQLAEAECQATARQWPAV